MLSSEYDIRPAPGPFTPGPPPEPPQPHPIPTDPTLTEKGMPADAWAVGARLWTKQDRLIPGEGIDINCHNVISTEFKGSYDELKDKPSINGIELDGNLSTKDLNINYNDLQNKPPISIKDIKANQILVAQNGKFVNQDFSSLFWEGSQEEYDNLPQNKPNIFYAVVDEINE